MGERGSWLAARLEGAPRLLSREGALRGVVPFRVACGADEVHHARTPDGWRVALSRYRPRERSRRHPVILCHGLASNRFAFDLGPEASLARHLRDRGYDVFALELRGAGLSDRPWPPSGRGYGWTFDDYLLADVPAAIDFVRALTGARQVHWIGHSMGGILLYAHLARGGEGVRAGITVGSSLDYSRSDSEFHLLARLVGVTAVIPALPLGVLALLGAPGAGRVFNVVERFQYWPSNIEPLVARRLFAAGFQTVSSGVLAQLATAFEPGGLRARDGLPYLSGLASARTPVLALAGDMDRQCPPDAAQQTLDALGTDDKRLVVRGVEHGQADHYGHFDLLCGRRAPGEVFPEIDAWLDAHDAEQRQTLRSVA